MQIQLDKLAEAFGFKIDGAQRVRLGPGVVGNTTTAMIFGVIGLAVEAIALKSQPAVMFGVMAVTFFLFLVYLIGTWRFAAKNPDLALMGGAELLQLRQWQMAAKGLPELAPTAPSTDPSKSAQLSALSYDSMSPDTEEAE